MTDESLKRLKALNIGEIIFIIFIVISVSGIIANEYEKGYILKKNTNGKKIAHYIRLAVLVVALLVYIYFLKTRVEKVITAKTFLNNLDVLATILFVIGGIIFIYTEYKGDEEAIIIE